MELLQTVNYVEFFGVRTSVRSHLFHNSSFFIIFIQDRTGRAIATFARFFFQNS